MYLVLFGVLETKEFILDLFSIGGGAPLPHLSVQSFASQTRTTDRTLSWLSMRGNPNPIELVMIVHKVRAWTRYHGDNH